MIENSRAFFYTIAGAIVTLLLQQFIPTLISKEDVSATYSRVELPRRPGIYDNDTRKAIENSLAKIFGEKNPFSSGELFYGGSSTVIRVDIKNDSNKKSKSVEIVLLRAAAIFATAKNAADQFEAVEANSNPRIVYDFIDPSGKKSVFVWLSNASTELPVKVLSDGQAIFIEKEKTYFENNFYLQSLIERYPIAAPLVFLLGLGSILIWAAAAIFAFFSSRNIEFAARHTSDAEVQRMKKILAIKELRDSAIPRASIEDDHQPKT